MEERHSGKAETEDTQKPAACGEEDEQQEG